MVTINKAQGPWARERVIRCSRRICIACGTRYPLVAFWGQRQDPMSGGLVLCCLWGNALRGMSICLSLSRIIRDRCSARSRTKSRSGIGSGGPAVCAQVRYYSASSALPAMPPVPTGVRSRIKLDTRHAAAPLPMRRSLFRSRDMACRSANAGAIVFGHRRFNPPARNPHVHGARPARGGVYQQPQHGH